MSHKQNPSPTQNYNAALVEAKTKSPLQTKLEGIASADIDKINSGDYTKLPHDIFFSELPDVAQQQHIRELEAGRRNQGVAALGGGGANPTVLALDAKNRDDEAAQRQGSQYEQGVARGAERAFGAAENLDSMDQARRLGVLSATVGPYQTQLNKPGWFSRLMAGLGSAGQAFGQAATGGGGGG